MTTVAELLADKTARREAEHAAAQKMKALWPTRLQPWPKCRGTEGDCNSGQSAGRDGFCSVCHKRVVTLIVRGYEVHPLATLKVSYARYRAATPQSAPKPNRKSMSATPSTPPEPPRIFAEGVTPMFPDVKAALERKHANQASRVVAAEVGPMSMEEALEKATALPAPPPIPPRASWVQDADTIDALHAEISALRANLRDPAFLRAALARIDAKAEQLATLTRQRAEIDAQIAELEKNE